jgi:hypothetical protein
MIRPIAADWCRFRNAALSDCGGKWVAAHPACGKDGPRRLLRNSRQTGAAALGETGIPQTSQMCSEYASLPSVSGLEIAHKQGLHPPRVA